MLGATHGRHGVLQCQRRAGARHEPADRRLLPRAARPVERDAAAGSHRVLGRRGRGSLCRLRPRDGRRRQPRADARRRSRSWSTRCTGAIASCRCRRRSSTAFPKQQYFEVIPVMAAQALASGSPQNNPRVPTADEIAQLYTGGLGVARRSESEAQRCPASKSSTIEDRLDRGDACRGPALHRRPARRGQLRPVWRRLQPGARSLPAAWPSPARRSGSRRRRSGRRVSGVGGFAAAAPRAHSEALSRAARARSDAARRDHHVRTRQGLVRRQGRGAARHRGRRVRDRHSAAAQG